MASDSDLESVGLSDVEDDAMAADDDGNMLLGVRETNGSDEDLDAILHANANTMAARMASNRENKLRKARVAAAEAKQREEERMAKEEERRQAVLASERKTAAMKKKRKEARQKKLGEERERREEAREKKREEERNRKVHEERERILKEGGEKKLDNERGEALVRNTQARGNSDKRTTMKEGRDNIDDLDDNKGYEEVLAKDRIDDERDCTLRRRPALSKPAAKRSARPSISEKPHTQQPPALKKDMKSKEKTRNKKASGMKRKGSDDNLNTSLYMAHDSHEVGLTREKSKPVDLGLNVATDDGFSTHSDLSGSQSTAHPAVRRKAKRIENEEGGVPATPNKKSDGNAFTANKGKEIRKSKSAAQREKNSGLSKKRESKKRKHVEPMETEEIVRSVQKTAKQSKSPIAGGAPVLSPLERQNDNDDASMDIVFSAAISAAVNNAHPHGDEPKASVAARESDVLASSPVKDLGDMNPGSLHHYLEPRASDTDNEEAGDKQALNIDSDARSPKSLLLLQANKLDPELELDDNRDDIVVRKGLENSDRPIATNHTDANDKIDGGHKSPSLEGVGVSAPQVGRDKLTRHSESMGKPWYQAQSLASGGIETPVQIEVPLTASATVPVAKSPPTSTPDLNISNSISIPQPFGTTSPKQRTANNLEAPAASAPERLIANGSQDHDSDRDMVDVDNRRRIPPEKPSATPQNDCNQDVNSPPNHGMLEQELLMKGTMILDQLQRDYMEFAQVQEDAIDRFLGEVQGRRISTQGCPSSQSSRWLTSDERQTVRGQKLRAYINAARLELRDAQEHALEQFARQMSNGLYSIQRSEVKTLGDILKERHATAAPTLPRTNNFPTVNGFTTPSPPVLGRRQALSARQPSRREVNNTLNIRRRRASFGFAEPGAGGEWRQVPEYAEERNGNPLYCSAEPEAFAQVDARMPRRGENGPPSLYVGSVPASTQTGTEHVGLSRHLNSIDINPMRETSSADAVRNGRYLAPQDATERKLSCRPRNSHPAASSADLPSGLRVRPQEGALQRGVLNVAASTAGGSLVSPHSSPVRHSPRRPNGTEGLSNHSNGIGAIMTTRQNDARRHRRGADHSDLVDSFAAQELSHVKAGLPKLSTLSDLKRFVGSDFDKLGLNCVRSAAILTICNRKGGVRRETLYAVMPTSEKMVAARVKMMLDSGHLVETTVTGAQGDHFTVYTTSHASAALK